MIKAEETGDKLSEDELLAMVFLLLIAGHETTVNLISGGVLVLLENRFEKKSGKRLRRENFMELKMEQSTDFAILRRHGGVAQLVRAWDS